MHMEDSASERANEFHIVDVLIPEVRWIVVDAAPLVLTDHIEEALKKLPDHFPGFRFERVASDRGWGAAVSRDDVGRGDGGRANFFSRLEMTIRPFSTYHVLELTARGTIRNKEVFNRTHYQRLTEANPSGFSELIDLWILEYAELYAAKS